MSEDTKEMLRRVLDGYQHDRRYNDAIRDRIVEDMIFEPDYIGNFTGKTFQGEEKEYWQGADKIQSYFKGFWSPEWLQ